MSPTEVSSPMALILVSNMMCSAGAPSQPISSMSYQPTPPIPQSSPSLTPTMSTFDHLALPGPIQVTPTSPRACRLSNSRPSQWPMRMAPQQAPSSSEGLGSFRTKREVSRPDPMKLTYPLSGP